MIKRYSIAEARQNLAAIVHELDHTSQIELTRRGTAVAVLLSFEAYQRLQTQQHDFWSAYTVFRSQSTLADADVDELLAQVRDRSAGREVVL